MKDSPVSWTVPSNSSPVDPQGPPHWSSVLGDIKVLDFRVQISTNKSFDGIKADWYEFPKDAWYLTHIVANSGGSSVGQNKLLQLILGYIYILKCLQSSLIG